LIEPSQVTEHAFNRMVLARLLSGDSGALSVRCGEEVGAAATLEFIMAVERFHKLATNTMPAAAHDIVEVRLPAVFLARG